MNPNHTFTEKYFYEELGRFRQAMGNREWWMNPDNREACVKGITFVYLNLVNEDGSLPSNEQITKWGSIFNATMSEYAQRESIMLLRGLAKVS